MDNATPADPFEVVIANLTAQRDRIDQTIQVLRQLKASGFTDAGAALGAATALTTTPVEDTKSPNDAMGPGAFLGMTIVDAAKKLLTHERRQMGNVEIADSLKRGGLVLNSADPVNTIGSVMTRRFQQIGDVVRVGRGTWGLKEWYPNRTFKTAAKADAASTQTESAPNDSSPDPSSFAGTASASGEAVVYRNSDLTVEDLV